MKTETDGRTNEVLQESLSGVTLILLPSSGTGKGQGKDLGFPINLDFSFQQNEGLRVISHPFPHHHGASPPETGLGKDKEWDHQQ